MAGVFKTVTFFVLVFAAVTVFAEDYDVGDDTKWTRPTDPEFYTTWAAGKTFRVGDELEFEFDAGRHDVAVVTPDAYENCDTEKPINLMKTSPVKIILNTTGPQYFICTVPGHCRFGQKLTVNVVGATGGAAGASGGGASAAPGAGPSVGGATPPTTSGTTTPTDSSGTTSTTTPPAESAASSLGGATFLVAIVSAVVALF